MEVLRPTYRELTVYNKNDVTKSKTKFSTKNVIDKDDTTDKDNEGTGFGSNVQTFKRDTLHLKRLFPHEHRSYLKSLLKDAIPPESWLPSYPDLYTVEEQLAERAAKQQARRQRRSHRPLTTAESFRAVDALVYPDLVSPPTLSPNRKSTKSSSVRTLPPRTHSSSSSSSHHSPTHTTSAHNPNKPKSTSFSSSSEDEDYVDTEVTSAPEDSDDSDTNETPDIYTLPHRTFPSTAIDENDYPFRQQMRLHCHHNHIPLIPRPAGYTSDDDGDESLPEVDEDLPVFITTANKTNEWQTLAGKAIAALNLRTANEPTESVSPHSSSLSGSSTWEDSEDDDEDTSDSYESESFLDDEGDEETNAYSSRNRTVTRVNGANGTKRSSSRLSSVSSPPKGKKTGNGDRSVPDPDSTVSRGRKVAVATLIHHASSANSKTQAKKMSTTIVTHHPKGSSLTGSKRQRGHLRVIGAREDDDEGTDNSASSFSEWSDDSEAEDETETDTESFDEESDSAERTNPVSSAKRNASVPSKKGEKLSSATRSLSASRLHRTLPDDDENIVSDEELSHAMIHQSRSYPRRTSLRRSSSATKGTNDDQPGTTLRSSSSRQHQASRTSTLRSSSTLSVSKSRNDRSPPSRTTISRNSSSLSTYPANGNSTNNGKSFRSKSKPNTSPSSSRLNVSKRLRIDRNVLSDKEDEGKKYPPRKVAASTKKFNISPSQTSVTGKVDKENGVSTHRKSSRLHPSVNLSSVSSVTGTGGQRISGRIHNPLSDDLYALW